MPRASSGSRRKSGLSAINMKPPEEVEKEYDEIMNSKDARVTQFLGQVSEAFHLFDQNQNVIDVREVGCLIRSLGMYPSRLRFTRSSKWSKIHRLKGLSSTRDLFHTRSNWYQGPTDSQIETVFEVLDTEKAGYFDLQRMKNIMAKDGEPFSSDQFDDMMLFGYNEDEQKFDWRLYLKKAGLRVADDNPKTAYYQNQKSRKASPNSIEIINDAQK